MATRELSTRGMRCTLDGAMGDYMRAVTQQWLLVAPRANPAMLDMFRDRDRRPYPNMVLWAGEFAGKYSTSAVQLLRLTADDGRALTLCDFASAGSGGSPYRSWLRVRGDQSTAFSPRTPLRSGRIPS